MGRITREQYIEKTLTLAESSISEAYKAKYWELAGRAMGYLEPPKVENQNIAVFQSISGEMMAFLQKRTETLESIDSLPSGSDDGKS